MPTVLNRAELSVAGIAQAGDDVFFRIQMAIQGGKVNRDIRVFVLQGRHALGGSDEGQELNLLHPPFLEDIYAGNGGATRGKHWINDDGQVQGGGWRQFFVIDVGLASVMVAIQAQVPDLGIRHQLQDSVRHPQARAENRHQADPLGQPLSVAFCQGRGHRHGGERQIGSGLIKQELGQLAHESTEDGRRCVTMTHGGHAVLHQGVLRHPHPRNGRHQLVPLEKRLGQSCRRFHTAGIILADQSLPVSHAPRKEHTPMPSPSVPLRQQQLHDERIRITDVQPQVDQGRYAVKRVVGDTVEVQATVFRDGHDKLNVVLQYGAEDTGDWIEVPMKLLGNDRWSASFTVERLTDYKYTIEAWTDQFGTWQEEVHKKATAEQDVTSELLEGVEQIQRAVKRAREKDHQFLLDVVEAIRSARDQEEVVAAALDPALSACMTRNAERLNRNSLDRLLTVVVDLPLARFATWYEFFPRSQGKSSDRSGTFADCINRLPEIAHLGFDVVYLPPIHPIGRSYRKGKNNSLTPGPNDPGSPWAIGNELGGHTAIEPSLGTEQDFKDFVTAARDLGIAVALDFAIQCSPDHPYVTEHPEWFYHRPDGTIKYAENPPKKYQDIYPLNFDSPAWPALWEEWKRVLLHWIGLGVTIFRVDNPHTKPTGFWEWLIAEIKRDHPEAIFLAEAFTRPALMKTLAKVGFSQSYTYFTWRNTKQELIQYATELTATEMKDYFRGNFFANTPDILHEYLQHAGPPAFKVRYILAATLSSLCGIYSGYELCENIPLKPGSEEYLDSEKYQIKVRDWNAPGNIKEFIQRVNQARRENRALQLYDNLTFHQTHNEWILCYSKTMADHSNTVLVVVNLDPKHPQEDMVLLDLKKLGLEPQEQFQVEDVISGSSWTWHGNRNYIRLDPRNDPAHLFVLRRKPREVSAKLTKQFPQA